MTQGNTYTVTVILKDEANFEWTETFKEFTITFELGEELTRLEKPELTVTELSYTGGYQTFSIKNWESKYSAYLEMEGSLRQINAGEYKVKLRFKDQFSVPVFLFHVPPNTAFSILNVNVTSSVRFPSHDAEGFVIRITTSYSPTSVCVKLPVTISRYSAYFSSQSFIWNIIGLRNLR